MAWLDDFNRSIGLASQIILYGNINDRFSVLDDNSPNYKNNINFLKNIFEKAGYDIIGIYDIVDGLTFSSSQMREKYDAIMNDLKPQGKGSYRGGFGEESQLMNQSNGSITNGIKFPTPIDALAAIRKIMINRQYPAVIIVNFCDKLISISQQQNDEEKRIHIILQKMAQEAADVQKQGKGYLKNTTVLLADELGSLPKNLYINNPYTKQIFVGKPSKLDRERFISFYKNYFYSQDGKVSVDDTKQFVDLTEGMSIVDMANLALLSSKDRIPIESSKELVSVYKFGIKQNHWAELDTNKIKQAEMIISQRVIGQDEAVKAVVDMIIRAKMGMSGIQHSATNAKPKGTLLFVGPTGVGKTELAKSTAEFLFGDENACIRFDMSEYNHEHADQRLVGAPPGYVGFEEGGQLTNKVKERPFSVLLFDEIEKAHPRIFDKFLQILEDGRLTDGKGETVYFSESVIIFTSNIGADQVLDNNLSPGEVKGIFVDAVNKKFREEWGRPELLNRIGENIIVFQPIKSFEFKKGIIDKMLRQVSSKIESEYHVQIIWDDSVYETIINSPDGFGKNGARGAGNIVEKLIINKLARLFFFNGFTQGDKFTVYYDTNDGISIKRGEKGD